MNTSRMLVYCTSCAILLSLSACKETAKTGGTAAQPDKPDKPDEPTVEPADDAIAEPPPINPPVDNCNITPPDAPITSALLGSGLPCAVTVIKPITLPNLQHAFDFHSWLVWLALNAPAGGGVIGSGSAPGGDAATVWEGWRNVADLMLPGGAEPPPWGAPPGIPPACEALNAGAKGHHVLRMVGKTPDLLTDFDQPFDTGPLIDQAGNYVRYELLVNQPMFEFIVQNKLYSKVGQQAFTQPITFPEGQVVKDTNGTIGAIMVKAAWKPIDGDDQATTFHTTEALVYTPPSENPKIEESCTLSKVALVGLHVVQKTTAEPQWVWSTFEHVANAPDQASVDAKQLAAHYNFYDPSCKAAACPPNQPPPRPWDPNVQPFPDGFHSQITRVTPVTSEVAELNAAFQALLPNTVWQHYQLVSTQWPTDATSATDPNGVPAPVFLANTTMETYVQGTVPQSSSSCMGCHGNAATTTGADADFTFVLERAQ